MAHETDKLLTTVGFRKMRAYWIDLAMPCSKCGCAINYAKGHKGPDAFELGHKVGRVEARRQGWTDEQINMLSNTQPECRRCNRSDGARYANRVMAARRAADGVSTKRNGLRVALESDEW